MKAVIRGWQRDLRSQPVKFEFRFFILAGSYAAFAA
jgi:hypothetical protein